MLISAVQPFTILDYPEKIACIIFTAGCNFRCGYCHNSEFVLPEKIQEIKQSFLSEDTIFNFLEKRKGCLDAVVISGGEPTMQADLIDFIKSIHKMGYLVKLDTNGSNPNLIKELLDNCLLDYIAMDVKISLGKYRDLCGIAAQIDNIEQSIELIQDSSIDYEFRSTLIKEIHTRDILIDMAHLLKGSKLLYLQKFRSGETLCNKFTKFNAFTDLELKDIQDLFLSYNINTIIR